MDDKNGFLHRYRFFIGIYLLWSLFHLGSFCYHHGLYRLAYLRVPKLFFFLVVPVMLALLTKLFIRKPDLNRVKIHSKANWHYFLVLLKKHHKALLAMVVFILLIVGSLMMMSYFSQLEQMKKTNEINTAIEKAHAQIYSELEKSLGPWLGKKYIKFTDACYPMNVYLLRDTDRTGLFRDPSSIQLSVPFCGNSEEGQTAYLEETKGSFVLVCRNFSYPFLWSDHYSLGSKTKLFEIQKIDDLGKSYKLIDTTSNVQQQDMYVFESEVDCVRYNEKVDQEIVSPQQQ